MIFTGYHAKKYPGCKRVSVSVGTPSWSEVDTQEKSLMPTYDLVKIGKLGHWREYREGYDKILQRAKEIGTFVRLLEDSKTEDIVLLCWEKDVKECHRRFIAEFFKKEYGISVPEKR